MSTVSFSISQYEVTPIRLVYPLPFHVHGAGDGDGDGEMIFEHTASTWEVLSWAVTALGI